MSHELRTPLNSLLILAEQLEDNPGDTMSDAQVEYASTIRSSGQDLLKLLNSILDLAKIESGTITVEMTEIGADQLRGDLLRDFEPMARGKSLNFSVQLAPEGPRRIATDPDRLRQILKNLIANAFKFTEQGGVYVRVAAAGGGWSPESTTLTSAASVIAVSVRDTGIGIEEGQQLRIFEAFAQGDGSTSRLYGGTGLGLSISRALVALLGGEIVLVSTPGQGCTFTVYLPQGPMTTDEPIASSNGRMSTPGPAIANAVRDDPDALGVGTRPGSEPPRLDGSPFTGTGVLVVDDDFRNVFALSALLERGDATVTVAENGPDAIAMLEQTPGIDIVLMDIMMPGMDGYAAIRAIRAIDRFRAIPIIAVTGKVVNGERQRCLEAGANDYVPKPVNTQELLVAIKPWLRAPASVTK
jgi:CheY-like chemotaxis protein